MGHWEDCLVPSEKDTGEHHNWNGLRTSETRSLTALGFEGQVGFEQNKTGEEHFFLFTSHHVSQIH